MARYYEGYYTDYLEHWGLKGQKWGTRRYQYEDGSYTEEGKIRYGRIKKTSSLAGEQQKKIENQKRHDAVMASKNPRYVYKNRDVLSDKELNDKTNRFQRELQLKKIADQQSTIAKGVAILAAATAVYTTIKNAKPMIDAGRRIASSILNSSNGGSAPTSTALMVIK